MEELKPVVHRALAMAGHMAVGLHRVVELAEGLDCSLVHMTLADCTEGSKEGVESMGLAEAVDHMVVRIVAVVGRRVGCSEVEAGGILGSTVAAYSFGTAKVAAVM